MKARFVACLATPSDREQIYRIRHDVYAKELGQHPCNAEERLIDDLDNENEYIVIREKEQVIAFISITPPSAKSFSIDKYFCRQELPIIFHDHLYELRLLTIIKTRRNTIILPLMIRAIFTYLKAKGASEVIAIGRDKILPMYQEIGFKRLGFTTRLGQVLYELMKIDEGALQKHCKVIFF